MATMRGGRGVLDAAAAFTSLGTATSSTYDPDPGTTVITFSVKATKAGSWILYGLSGNGSDLVALTDARTVTADTRDAYSESSAWPFYVLKFTDTSGNTGTVEFRVEGCGPSMGGRGGEQYVP